MSWAKTKASACAGLLPNYAKILPSAAISFYVYELMKQMFDIDK